MSRKLFKIFYRSIALVSLYIAFCVISYGNYGLPVNGMQESEKTPSASDEFKTLASSFLTTYCTNCHGIETQEADLRFDAIGYDLSDAKAARLWSDILAQVQSSEMPPEDADQPDANKKSQFLKGSKVN